MRISDWSSDVCSSDLLDVGGRPLYQRVAERVARDWNGHGNCALVVGATWPEQLREVRAIVGDMPLLIPGVGAQGGDVAAVVENGLAADGAGLLVSSSRAILDRKSTRLNSSTNAHLVCRLL